MSTEEMAEQFRVLDALIQDLSSVPRTHMTAHISSSSSGGTSTLRHQSHKAKTLIRIKMKNKKKIKFYSTVNSLDDWSQFTNNLVTI